MKRAAFILRGNAPQTPRLIATPRSAALRSVLAMWMVAGCSVRTPAERGEALFSDPMFSSAETNFVSCATCHASADVSEDRVLAGGTLRAVLGRPSYWGATVLDPREAIEACLYYFMLEPDRRALEDTEDPRGADLLEYLATLGEDPAEPIPFTVPVAVVRDDLPVGDPVRGASTYDAACRACHGAPHDGEGRPSMLVPAIPDPLVAQHGSYAGDITVAKVRHGGFYGIGGSMPPFSLEVLDDAALADLLAFLGI